ncbi:hypothetical protein NDU88_009708 [Pleurodeles waltl]|uniref:Uncharacterized protein n=1 Tax=Pleurodeles waltl TaxID=8319 RepID=A0AAV7PT79_PLEWA|nr:hypothetical protein NDU88_009708 [Pleurodeles waltl]
MFFNDCSLTALLNLKNVFPRLLKNLEKKLLKLEEEITSKKQRKFIRDFKDCQAGRILTFQRKYDHMYSEDTTESNVMDCELVNKPVEEQEESDISDGNLSDVPDTVLFRVSTSDKEKDRLNFLKQFRLLNQGRTEQHKETYPQRGRGEEPEEEEKEQTGQEEGPEETMQGPWEW